MKRTLMIMLAAGACVPMAAAQDRAWLVQDGNWNLPANWSGNNVPNTATETATIAVPGAYTVSMDVSQTIQSLFLVNPQATLGIPGGRNITISSATSTNNGLILLNVAGDNVSTLWTSTQSMSIEGSGVLRLNANPANLESARLIPAGTLTNGVGHTIAGTGKIDASWTNNGTIDADAAGKQLDSLNGTRVNNELLRASNGGRLRLLGTITQAADGLISADGGTVICAGVTVNGGTIEAVNGGEFELTTSSLRLEGGVRLAADIGIPGGLSLLLSGGVVLDGRVLVRSTPGTAIVQTQAATTLSGAGEAPFASTSIAPSSADRSASRTAGPSPSRIG